MTRIISSVVKGQLQVFGYDIFFSVRKIAGNLWEPKTTEAKDLESTILIEEFFVGECIKRAEENGA